MTQGRSDWPVEYFGHVLPQPVRELGAAKLAEVNQRSGGPSPGVVAWPKPK